MLIILALTSSGLAASAWGVSGLVRNTAGGKPARAVGVVVGLALLLAAGAIVASFVGNLSGLQVYTYAG